jgi:ADP-heptose:LPS heptosyltransferase
VKADQRAAPDYRHILLIRTDRIGDLVLSTPAIASFRRSWPAARIEVLVTDYTEPVLRYNPDIDAAHVLPRGLEQARVLARALGSPADLAVALAPRTQDYRLAAWSRAPRRLGYVYRRRYLSRIAARFLLTEHAISEADPDLADRYPDNLVAHEVTQVLTLVTLAGGRASTEELVLRVGDGDEAFARECVPDGAVCINLAPRWFAPDFGAGALRALIERLADDQRDVLVTYGTDVADAAAQLRGAVLSPNVTWLGESPLLRWAAALARCRVVVTVDCGATHIAAAMRVPVVVVYEHAYYRLSSQEWSPWRVPSAILRKPPPGAAVTSLVDDILAASRALAARPRT